MGGDAQGSGEGAGTPAPPGRRRLRILTTATYSHRDMLENWLLHVREVEHLEPHVIALDAETVKFCRGMEVSVEQADTEGLKKSMKAKGLHFTSVGVAKLLSLQVVQRVLKGGSDVLFSDVDVAWLSDPWAYLDTEPLADLLISIDCLSPRYDEGRAPPIRHWANYFPAQAWPGWWPRCGHTHGDAYGVAYNAGVLFLRANERAVAFMDAFVDNMLKMAAPADNHLEGTMLHDMTDQESLIHLVAEGAYPLKMLPGSKRVFSTMKGRLNAGTFPVSVVANGHVYFVQQHHQKVGKSPIAVHTTFNPGGPPLARRPGGLLRGPRSQWLHRVRRYGPPGAVGRLHCGLPARSAPQADGILCARDDAPPRARAGPRAGARHAAAHLSVRPRRAPGHAPYVHHGGL